MTACQPAHSGATSCLPCCRSAGFSLQHVIQGIFYPARFGSPLCRCAPVMSQDRSCSATCPCPAYPTQGGCSLAEACFAQEAHGHSWLHASIGKHGSLEAIKHPHREKAPDTSQNDFLRPCASLGARISALSGSPCPEGWTPTPPEALTPEASPELSPSAKEGM